MASVLSHFNVSTSNRMFPYGNHYDSIDGVSVDECADACLTEMTFECQSFDYCYAVGRCQLSANHPATDNPGTLVPSNFCNVYSRNYLDKYIKSPGTVVRLKADYENPSLSSTQCAHECTTNTNMSCRSFEYCSTDKTCRIFKSHKLDMPVQSFTSDSFCSFYSRDYLDDFKKLERSTLVFGRTLDFTEVTVSQCAKLCVDTQELNCASFAFCGNTSFCRLTESHPKQQGILVARDFCDLYARQYALDGTKYTLITAAQVNPTTPPSSSKRYSAGAVAGVAIGLLIPGIIFGAALLHFIRKRREQAG